MYKFRQFIIVENKNSLILQNNKSISIIKNSNLINYIKYIDENGYLEVERKEMQIFFKETDINNVIDFLLSNEIIYSQDKISQFLNHKIITNDISFKRVINYLMPEVLFDINTLDTFNKENTHIFVFLNPFNKKILKEYMDILNLNNYYFSCAFNYNNSIYISNLYNSKLYNPCPMCMLNSIEFSIRNGEYDDNISFQSIIDVIYNNNLTFNIERQITNQEYIIMLSEILKQQVQNIECSLKRWTYISNNLDVKYDVAIHNDFCECLDGEE